MGIKSDRTYVGTVLAGSHLFQSNAKKTPGFRVLLDCEDGETHFDIWLTHKNSERAREAFVTLGADPEQLKSAAYLKYELAGAIVGKQVEFSTQAEEYRGEWKVKVQFIGPVGAADENALAAEAAHIFGGEKPTPPKVEDDDDSVPF